MNLPNQIDLEFTEEDRQLADEYTSPNSCLLATALHRMGFQEMDLSFTSRIKIEDPETEEIVVYKADRESLEQNSPLHFMDYGAHKAPFYRPECVGKTITYRAIIKVD